MLLRGKKKEKEKPMDDTLLKMSGDFINALPWHRTSSIISPPYKKKNKKKANVRKGPQTLNTLQIEPENELCFHFLHLKPNPTHADGFYEVDLFFS